jgi:hypothetical protein
MLDDRKPLLTKKDGSFCYVDRNSHTSGIERHRDF